MRATGDVANPDSSGAIKRDLSDLVWVRTEISELRYGSGHLNPEFAERNDRGDALAQAWAVIRKNQVAEIIAEFERATSEGLRDTLKIFCLVRVRFDELYGFTLVIEDVDGGSVTDLDWLNSLEPARLLCRSPIRSSRGSDTN